MFGRMKDAALSKSAKAALNSYMKEYGRMLKLELDSKSKKVMLEVMLEGEKEPLQVELERYELTEEGGKHYLKAYGIHTSRAWINTVAATYLEGKAFEVPPQYVQMLKLVV